MAISSELIGSLGGNNEVTQDRIWFTNGTTREAAQIQRTWNVPRGNYLFAWQGSLTNVYAANSRLLINGQNLPDLPGSSTNGQVVGGFVVLYNVATITITGEGNKRFEADPYAAFVRVK